MRQKGIITAIKHLFQLFTLTKIMKMTKNETFKIYGNIYGFVNKIKLSDTTDIFQKPPKLCNMKNLSTKVYIIL